LITKKNVGLKGNHNTLKQLRPIGEGDQELEKKFVQEELT
jgi:hypothetical protein